MFELVNTC